MAEAWPWFAVPLLALAAGCVALAPLGAQVLARGVVFIDLAVAQGAAAAALWAAVWLDHPGPATVQGFALVGGLLAAALVAALVRRRPAGREALIGLVYVAGAAVAVLGAFDSPHGPEHLARMLAADLLWADPVQALTLAAAAAGILAVHRRWPAAWSRDAVFYPCFALVAAVAVPALGLFVVFAALIVPALWLRAGWRLMPALALALTAGAGGLALSWGLDRPSGACVALMLALAGLASVLWPAGLHWRPRGRRDDGPPPPEPSPMIAVIFEVVPRPGLAPRYFDLAAQLRPALEAVDGFVSVERFQSLTTPGKYLSLSLWRDEAAVRAWRCHGAHRGSQQEGRSEVFEGYRIRVAAVLRDYSLVEREQAPADSLAALF